MRIRKFSLGDLGPIVRIERASFGPEAYSVSTFLAHLFRDRKGLFVAEDGDGAVVGYVLARVGIRWLGVRRGGITSIAVGPAYRRRGFGTALMTAALEYLNRTGVDEADLEVNVSNRAAQSLYQAFGFVQSRLLPHYYGPAGDGVKMVLDLRRATDGSPRVTRAQQSSRS
ncbi:MAG: N-acetyltransferase family protein [Armatimonadota bacterium]